MYTSTGASSLVSPRSVSSHKGRYPTDALPLFLNKQPLLSFHPLSGNRSGLRLPCGETTIPSADFSSAINGDPSPFSQFPSHATSRGTGEISRGKTQNLPCVDAGFIKHTPIAEGGLHSHVPARPECTTPRIRFLFIAPQFWIGLPPDPASRRRPCPSPCLRLRLYLARGLTPRKLCAMPGTHALNQRRGQAL